MRCGRSSRTQAAIAAVALVSAAAACDREPPPPPQTAAPAAAAQTATMPHGDHNPHHGGIVMMKGDLHYEVVVDPAGKAHHLYFTDATRQDLPASIASQATLTIRRAGQADEAIPLQIDDDGESWAGHGRPVAAPEATTVRVAFTISAEPYFIDLPLPNQLGR